MNDANFSKKLRRAFEPAICKHCGSKHAYRINLVDDTPKVRCLQCDTMYTLEDDDITKEFETWFAPIERYINRELEEPKVEKEQ